MKSYAVLLSLTLTMFGPRAGANDQPDPCRTHSREMAMIKNCYTGDMMRPQDNRGQFLQFSESDANGVRYCYNSLIFVEHRPGDALVKIRVLRDAKNGEVRAYNYQLAPEEIKKFKRDTPLFALSGVKGQCFSPKGDKDACDGGLLKAIGWKDTDLPLIIALGRAANGSYILSHLITSPMEINLSHAPGLEASKDKNPGGLTTKLLQDIRAKLLQAARAKMSAMHSPASSPQKLAEKSEQFRYCSLALDGFLKDKNLPSPLRTEEKMVLATVTNYMNNDPAASGASNRAPAAEKPRH